METNYDDCNQRFLFFPTTYRVLV